MLANFLGIVGIVSQPKHAQARKFNNNNTREGIDERPLFISLCKVLWCVNPLSYS